jgi:hypothetical protein
MNTIKLLILSILVSCMVIPDLSAQQEFSPGVGIALKASTNGLGADAVYNFHNRMDIRLGFEKLGLQKNFSFEEKSVTYDAAAKLNAGSLSLLFDYHVAGHFFVTAGAGWNLFQTSVDGVAANSMQFGDIEIPKESIGSFSYQIDPSLKISPYFGIGFGRALGSEKKLACAFEIGGFYQGSPDISIVSDGLLSPTSNPDQQQAERMEKQINQYNIYPVLKLSVSYKIVSF